MTRIQTVKNTVDESLTAIADESFAQIAAVLQQRLMAHQPEVGFARWAVRMKPVAEISGDIVLTWKSRNDETLNCFVGDVVGHGSDAAFVSVIVAATLLRQDDMECHQRLEDLNRMLYLGDTGVVFCTGLMLSLGRDGLLGIASAGHPGALVLGVDGQVQGLPSVSGSPLGLFDELVHGATEYVRVVGGDRVLLLTDGLLERSDAGTRTKILPQAVRASVLRAGSTGHLNVDADTIWTLLRSLAGARGKPDDQTLLLLEYVAEDAVTAQA